VELSDGSIELGFDVRGDAVVRDVVNDADDGDPGGVGIATHLESTADRVAAFPVLARHRDVHERDLLGADRVARCQVAALDEPFAQRGKCAVRGHLPVAGRANAGLRRIAIHAQAPVADESSQRQHTHEARLRHTGCGARLAQQLVVESDDLLRCVVHARRQRQAHREHAIRVEAEVNLLQLPDASGEEQRADQQDHRHRRFANHQCVTHPQPLAAGRRTLRPVLERIRQVHPCRAQRRRQAEHEQRHHGECHGK